MSKTSEIRKKYPNAIPGHMNSGSYIEYCVGGAVCFFTGEGKFGDGNWPGRTRLGKALRILNPKLSETMSIDFAWQITGFNDSDKLESAWKVVEEAELYGGA